MIDAHSTVHARVAVAFILVDFAHRSSESKVAGTDKPGSHNVTNVLSATKGSISVD